MTGEEKDRLEHEKALLRFENKMPIGNVWAKQVPGKIIRAPLSAKVSAAAKRMGSGTYGYSRWI